MSKEFTSLQEKFKMLQHAFNFQKRENLLSKLYQNHNESEKDSSKSKKEK